MKDTPEGLRVVEGNHVDVDLFATRLLDQLQAICDHGECREAQEVHLQQAHFFDCLHVVGGHNFVVLGAIDGDQFGEGPRAR